MESGQPMHLAWMIALRAWVAMLLRNIHLIWILCLQVCAIIPKKVI